MSVLLLVLFWKVLSYQRRLDQAARFQLAQLERAALIDNLTTLGNHRAYQEQVPRALDEARQQDETLALALIDVDEFKLINDTYGHAHGDRVLNGLGMLLRDISADAAPYRLGGDEFALLLPRCSLAEATLELEHLCQEAPRRLFGATLSIGIANSTPEVSVVQTLQEQADVALYEAKRRGRNRVATFEDVQEGTSRIPAAKAKALQRLLAEGHVGVAFQPIWDLKQGGLLAFEALTRPAAKYGFTGPQEAFDIAEQLGHAAQLDRICLRAILARVAELRPDGLLFVNLSPQTLDHDLLAGTTLVQAVKAAGRSPDQVVLEITERSIARLDVVVREARRLRSLGFGLALDDTGAGNAGLEVLSQLPFDYVKIDRAVVAKGLTDQTARGVLSGITAIARETAAYVIAEGIENVEMFDLVRQMGVQGVQGYLLGRPSETLPNTSSLEELGPLAQIS
jgi:diguanylate cyclase (GGDEF)-like protein